MTAWSGARPPLREGGASTLPYTKVPQRTVDEEQRAPEAAVTAQEVSRKHLPGLFKKLTHFPDFRRPGCARSFGTAPGCAFQLDDK
jgi:hypothetical protein